ncbi:hypothetical protein [uncultured Rikenella sp.]|uniref:THUMP-like domain-containing protein n=1 Tax=uncultured Rikenella sp. TaxID=368003 RepID=UPI00262B53B7|nr:hypothetical protein [uncultured Rikenella sp.]
MERHDLDILLADEARQLVERYLESDPERLAFALRNPAVTRQIRMLQKCRSKLPSYYAARCIVPQVAYEQSSSEAAAGMKAETLRTLLAPHERRLAVDLTCGLGVDARALGGVFERVIAVESDPLRAEIARWNLGLLGVGNVEVRNGTAEAFLEQWTADTHAGQTVDLVYIDPSRKSGDGRRVYSLEESSPNVLALLPVLRRAARRIVLKLSPLFDVDEVNRLFGPEAGVEVVSVDGECKEVLVWLGFSDEADRTQVYRRVTAIRHGGVERFDFAREQAADSVASTGALLPGEERFLAVPDVGFYKSRTVAAYAAQYLGDVPGGWRLEGDCLFTAELPEHFVGKVYRITFRHPYRPKEIARLLRMRSIRRANIHRRGFSASAEEVAQALGVRLGGNTDLFCLTMQGEPTVFFVGRVG